MTPVNTGGLVSVVLALSTVELCRSARYVWLLAALLISVIALPAAFAQARTGRIRKRPALPRPPAISPKPSSLTGQ